MATMGDTAPPADVETAEEEVVQKFKLPVDANNKATKINIFSIARPHMRAFHFAWFSFFLAFFGWFALAPLQKKIKSHPNNAWLAKGERFKYQNIISVAGTIFMRLLIGPFCDTYGPRLAQAGLLGVFSLPLFLVGTARSYATWTIARFFIGFIGASFVVTQFWTSVMFSGNIVGTANATSGGWGNLGGGVTQAIMPLIRKGISRGMGYTDATDNEDDRSWRVAVIIPAASLVLTAVALYFLSDDVPEGTYVELKKKGNKSVNGGKSMLAAVTNWRVWILFFIYGGCFGVELIMNGNLATYFSGNDGKEAFDLSESRAGLIASLFGLMNLFARTTGGFGSDFFNKRWGIRGRLWWLFIVQFVEGIAFVCFSRARVLGLAAPLLITFSLFVQMAEGATFGIVPFVDPPALGAISGIVGAGGNFGAVAGGFLLSPSKEDGISDGFFYLGFIVIGTALLVPLLHFPQYGSMFLKPKVVEEIEE